MNSPSGAGAEINARERQASSDGCLDQDLRVPLRVGPVKARAPVATDGHGFIFALQTNTEIDESRRVNERVA